MDDVFWCREAGTTRGWHTYGIVCTILLTHKFLGRSGIDGGDRKKRHLHPTPTSYGHHQDGMICPDQEGELMRRGVVSVVPCQLKSPILYPDFRFTPTGCCHMNQCIWRNSSGQTCIKLAIIWIPRLFTRWTLSSAVTIWPLTPKVVLGYPLTPPIHLILSNRGSTRKLRLRWQVYSLE